MTSACIPAGTLARTFLARWMRHRWRSALGKACSIAAIRPGAPSLMTSSGEGRPRSLRSARKSSQASADSPVPGARPMNAGLPSVVMPQAASTGSAGEPGCIRKKLGVQEQVVQRDAVQAAPRPGLVLVLDLAWQTDDTVDLEIAAWSPSASARAASTSRTDRPRTNEAITSDLQRVGLGHVRCRTGGTRTPRWCRAASAGTACTGPAVVLTVTSRYPLRDPGGHPRRPRPAGSGPGRGTR